MLKTTLATLLILCGILASSPLTIHAIHRRLAKLSSDALQWSSFTRATPTHASNQDYINAQIFYNMQQAQSNANPVVSDVNALYNNVQQPLPQNNLNYPASNANQLRQPLAQHNPASNVAFNYVQQANSAQFSGSNAIAKENRGPQPPIFRPQPTIKHNAATIPAIATTQANAPARSSQAFEKFSDNLFQIMAPGNIHRNMVYSPMSLQNILAMVSIGAAGLTKHELQAALQLPAQQEDVQILFTQMLQKLPQSEAALILVASKLYYSNQLYAHNSWRDFVNQVFHADFEPIDFRTPSRAAAHMNAWAAEKTRNRLPYVIAASSIAPQTLSVLLNAIYFKAKWAKQFSLDDTLSQKFFSMNGAERLVATMYAAQPFRYGDFPSLQAQIVELPYLDGNLSMWIILPHERQGLAAVEKLMQGVDFNQLESGMHFVEVTLRLPKFRIEFEENMVEPLKLLNIHQLFSNNAELTSFFANVKHVGVDQIQHKAYLDVNEAGSEAAAATFVKFVPLSLPAESVTFTANHPFMFVIRSPGVIHFIGHVVNL